MFFSASLSLSKEPICGVFFLLILTLKLTSLIDERLSRIERAHIFEAAAMIALLVIAHVRERPETYLSRE